MEKYYEFVASLDFGIMGTQLVSIDYTDDGDHLNLLSVWLMDEPNHPVLDVTDGLTDEGKAAVWNLINEGHHGRVNDQAELEWELRYA